MDSEYCDRYAKKEHLTNSTVEVDSDEDISDEESGSTVYIAYSKWEWGPDVTQDCYLTGS